MKKHRKLNILLTAFIAGFSSSSLNGFFDPQSIALLVQQLEQATKTVNNTADLIHKTDRMVQIVGDPKKALHSIRDLNDGIRQLDRIADNDTTHGIRRLNNSVNNLFSSKERFQSKVSDTMIIGGKETKRKVSLYEGFNVVEEGLNDYKKLVEKDSKIQKQEIERQKKLADELNHATTQSEIEKIQAALNASKAVQDASTSQLIKERNKLELKKLALENEKQKQTTAILEDKSALIAEAQERARKKEEERRQAIKDKLSQKFEVKKFNRL